MKWIKIDNKLINLASIARIEFYKRSDSPRRSPVIVFTRVDGGTMLTKACSSDEELGLLEALLIGSLGGNDEVCSL